MTVRYCLDTNVLLRLQDVNALGALGALSESEFILTDSVWQEATRKPTLGTAAKQILSGIACIKRHDFVPNSEETRQFACLRAHYPQATYHDGELSVIALCALNAELAPSCSSGAAMSLLAMSCGGP